MKTWLARVLRRKPKRDPLDIDWRAEIEAIAPTPLWEQFADGVVAATVSTDAPILYVHHDWIEWTEP